MCSVALQVDSKSREELVSTPQDRLTIGEVAQRAGCSLEEIGEPLSAAAEPASERLRALALRDHERWPMGRSALTVIQS
jgi:hypothetical protein